MTALLIMGAGCGGGTDTLTPEDDIRGVILIISDTLRADHLGCYGYTRETSPAIDRLAADGVRFERAYSSASWTTPSVASLFTSNYPSVHRAGHPDSGFGYSRHLPAAATTLAELLSAEGFRCFGVLNNPSISAEFGFDQGFEAYLAKERMRKGRPTVATHEKVIQRLHELEQERFFIVWHLLDPHWPYCPPEEHRVFSEPGYSGRFQHSFESADATPLVNGRLGLDEAEIRQVIALYDGEIRYMDQQVGRLLGALDELGLRDEVALVFTSDHGESFLEHGHFGHELPMYEENLRVPLIVSDPRLEPRTVPQIVESIDVAPTILDLLGLGAPDSFQGRSLRPLLFGTPGAWPEKPAYAEAGMFHERKTLRTAAAKLVWSPEGILLNDDFISGRRNPTKYLRQEGKLYDLSDAGENREVSRQQPERAVRLKQEIVSRMRVNEGAQLTGESIFRRISFDNHWQEKAVETAGVDYRNGLLNIVEDTVAHALWQVTFPRPVAAVDLRLLAFCDRPVDFFAISTDREDWQVLGWPESGPPVARPVEQTFEMNGATTLWLRFALSAPARASLKHIHLNARFPGGPSPDGTLRDELAALGYME